MVQYLPIDLTGRYPQERKPSKHDGNGGLERRSSASGAGSPDSGSSNSIPLEARPKQTGRAFNLTMDLKALRKELISKDTALKATPKEPRQVKGILRAPREKFPEDPILIREGAAQLKGAKKGGIPRDAIWTVICRKLVNPKALEAGKEIFEAREDVVIVMRVLSKDEIQDYAEITRRIRGSFYL